MDNFQVKDSGRRQEFSTGMVRDVNDDKILWHLVADGPMLKRYAIHLTNGAKKYSPRNWMLASTTEEYERFRESAYRHFMQWHAGDRDEDHAAAVYFNINGAEHVRDKMHDEMILQDQVKAAIRDARLREYTESGFSQTGALS